MDKNDFSLSPARAIKAYTEMTTDLQNAGRVTSKFLDKLIALEYTRSPASTKYHGNHTCGLLCHSVVVAECLMYLEKELDIHFENPESALIVGLFHDLCKLGRYEYDTKNQEWVYVKDKDRKTATFGGHATESLSFLLTNGVNLTEEEALCIRFHMGAYETNDWDAFDAAIKRYPTVLLTHMADMMASKFFNT